MNIRTDLAHEQAANLGPTLPAGVHRQQQDQDGVQVTIIEITTPEAATAMGKPQGRYITIDGGNFESSVEESETQIKLCSNWLRQLLPPQGLVLVLGLGNRGITPDALGPHVVDHIIATRHIEGDVARQAGLQDLRPVATLAPGILAQTGMEAGDISAWICKQIKPVAVLAVDALAAGSIERLGRTVQISDSGIVPGSGVQGSRKAISATSMGVPVVSMGVPMVIDSAVLLRSALEEAGVQHSDMPIDQDVSASMVTPHHIDLLVGRCSKVLATAINIALQSSLSPQDVRFLMN